MKRSLVRPFISISALLASLVTGATAQTLYVPGGATGIGDNTANGNIGIGVSNPAHKLTIDGAIAGQIGGSGDVLFIGNDSKLVDIGIANTAGLYGLQSSTVGSLKLGSGGGMISGANGYIGIGTTNPGSSLQVSGNGEVRVTLRPGNGANDRESLVDFWSSFDNYATDTGVRRVARIQAGFDGGVWGTEYMAFGVAGAGDAQNPPVERMRITATGRVGVGTTSPTHTLTVNGTIKAEEVVVEAGIAASDITIRPKVWADDVFAAGYPLPSIDDINAHIQAEGRLPGVPSTAEVAANGVSVSDMQVTLLRKIEELTLHQIRQERELTELKSQVAVLSGENAELRRTLP